MIPLRLWATPLTIGSFLLMASTGVLMFFEWDVALTAVAHQWFSWLFLLGAGGHIVANLRSFKRHLVSRAGRISIAGFTIVLAVSFFSWGMITGPQLERPIEEALVDAPLAALAAVIKVQPEELLARLAVHGIRAGSGQSIRDLSLDHNIDENRLLGIVFLPARLQRGGWQ